MRTGLIVAGLWLVACIWASVTIIPEDHRGVVWHRFAGGTDLTEPRPPGLALTWPFDKVYIYAVTPETRVVPLDLLCADGTGFQIETTITASPMPETLALLHKEIGPEYFDRVVIPEVQAVLRRLAGDRACPLDTAELTALAEVTSTSTTARNFIRLEALVIRAR